MEVQAETFEYLSILSSMRKDGLLHSIQSVRYPNWTCKELEITAYDAMMDPLMVKKGGLELQDQNRKKIKPDREVFESLMGISGFNQSTFTQYASDTKTYYTGGCTKLVIRLGMLGNYISWLQEKFFCKLDQSKITSLSIIFDTRKHSM